MCLPSFPSQAAAGPSSWAASSGYQAAPAAG